MKDDKISDEVLRTIDRAIPFPIIFELLSYELIQVAAAHKRASEGDSSKWVVSDHLRSDWVPQITERAPLPVAINMGSVYDQILTMLMPIEAEADECIVVQFERVDAILAVEREIKRLEAKLRRETQFNIKIDLHGKLKDAQALLHKMNKLGKIGQEI